MANSLIQGQWRLDRLESQKERLAFAVTRPTLLEQFLVVLLRLLSWKVLVLWRSCLVRRELGSPEVELFGVLVNKRAQSDCRFNESLVLTLHLMPR